MRRRSHKEYCFVAETIPASNPKLTEMKAAKTVRIAVALNLVKTSGSTSRLCWIERPQSPDKTLVIH